MHKIPKFSEKEAQEFFLKDYIDRGMMKWQGFYLSDHTKVLKEAVKHDDAENRRKLRPTQTLDEINRVINQALIKHQSVEIQRNLRDVNGKVPKLLVGRLLGYQDEQLFLTENQTVSYSDIRNIQLKSSR